VVKFEYKKAVDVTNLNIERGNNNIYVVKTKEKKQLLTSLKISKKGKAYKFSYKYFGWESQLKHIAQTFWLRSPAYEQNK